ncbi:MAG: hypothetical protein AABZ60_10645 [Planctomycetota bacterium]
MSQPDTHSTTTEVFGILICLVGLMIGLIACFTGYLPKNLASSYQRETGQLQITLQALNQTEQHLQETLKTYQKYNLEKIVIAEGWPTELDKMQQETQSLIDRESNPQIQPYVPELLKADDSDSEPAISQRIFELNSAWTRILEKQNQIQNDMNALTQEMSLLSNPSAFLAQIREHAELLRNQLNLDSSDLMKKVQLLSQEFSAKANELSVLQKQLTEIAQKGLVLPASSVGVGVATGDFLTSIEAEMNKSEDSRDTLLLIQSSRQLSKACSLLNEHKTKLENVLEELNKSWDELLVDMRIEEGLDYSKFYHLLKRVDLSTDPLKKSADSKTQQNWKEVSASDYKKHENHLGMVIRSKDRGQYESEASEVPAGPPGYKYVGNSQYGRWEGSGSDRFWIFYGQYRFLESLFWGNSYQRIPYRTYDQYTSNYRSGREYFGESQEYGTSGRNTRLAYGNSEYFRNNGYKDTGWKSTGGISSGKKYSPSYTPPPSTSSSSKTTRTRSFGGGGSRSFGK